MSNEATIAITREKHLDHLVRVVPLIVMGYGIQSYILMQMDGPFNTELLFTLGGLLILMIAGFVFYDVNHKVTLFESHLEIDFKFMKRTIHYHEIVKVEMSDPKESFGTLSIYTKSGKTRFLFIDDVEKLKQWIESRKNTSVEAAA